LLKIPVLEVNAHHSRRKTTNSVKEIYPKNVESMSAVAIVYLYQKNLYRCIHIRIIGGIMKKPIRKDMIIEEVLLKQVKSTGNSGHIIVPKRFKDCMAYILIINSGVIRPLIHYNRKKKMHGKTYLQAEITTNAGTHNLWIEKGKIPKIFTRA
jgi:putative transposon-encoded protein